MKITVIEEKEIDTTSTHLSKGMVTRHPDGRLVKIMSGYFLDPIYHRLSNHFHWREINKDGTLSDTEESGYGWCPRVVNKKSKDSSNEK